MQNTVVSWKTALKLNKNKQSEIKTIVNIIVYSCDCLSQLIQVVCKVFKSTNVSTLLISSFGCLQSPKTRTFSSIFMFRCEKQTFKKSEKHEPSCASV